MFGHIEKSKGYLFATHDLDQLLARTTHAMAQEVEVMEPNRLLNTAPEDLKRYLVEKYRVEPLRLRREDWYADYHETKVDVRYDQQRWIRDTSRPVLVPGELTEVRVPFEGEAELFYARPNTYTTTVPHAYVEKSELVLQYESPSDAPRDVRQLVDRTLVEIERYIGWQKDMIAGYNNHLPAAAAQTIEDRRRRLLEQSSRVAALGIPIKRKADAPRTYAIPNVRKKAVPTLPPADRKPFTPEPTWAMELYEHALKVIQDMALVMERSPEAFKTMNEESLRQHFLVQLNGQFEGKASGETFNMGGKTDILLREGERNAFIAECKFWKGPKAFGEAIDQLLSYSTWRDSKTAILVFNRGTNSSTVLASIDEVVLGHANYKRSVDWRHESGKRYVLHANGDVNREQVMTVLLFHVPS